jgi:tripeptide aminopeptidase
MEVNYEMMRAFERLINYTKYETGSDSKIDTCPSTSQQLVFGKFLVEEMKQLGITDANMNDHGYIYGTIEANIDHWSGTVIGFISHMDVVSEVPFSGISPRLVKNYDGGDILLNKDKNILLSPKEFETLKAYQGCDLVVTDGTTLLGADDKAGIAEILTMAEYLQEHPEIKHGTIKIGFTPDEEIGRGADLFDVNRFGADFAYTVDGESFGEVEYETFNAASAMITIQGTNIHPGSAKGKMKNALLIAMELNTQLPERERPEYTEKYEGFYHLLEMEGIVDHARLEYIIRDHDLKKLEEKKKLMETIVNNLNEKYGEGTVEAVIKDQYYNMSEKIKPHWHLIETAYEAIQELGIKPYSDPVRGGTDGSRLSFMGLPCPNLGTGAHNVHGKTEYACVQEMDQTVSVLVKISEKYGKRKMKC